MDLKDWTFVQRQARLHLDERGPTGRDAVKVVRKHLPRGFDYDWDLDFVVEFSGRKESYVFYNIPKDKVRAISSELKRDQFVTEVRGRPKRRNDGTEVVTIVVEHKPYG